MACIVLPQTGHHHSHTIILLHGKGSNGQEFAAEFFESETGADYATEGPQAFGDLFPTVRWVFPSAPQTRSTRFDCIESQWFDMWSVENPDEKVELQVDGLVESILLLRRTIAEEAQIIPQNKIFLGGISQGFATAIAAYLLDDFDVAGLVGLCTWMPKGAYRVIASSDKIEVRRRGNTIRAPVFLGHARDDNVVPIDNGLALGEFLLQRGFAVECHEYSSGGHWINEPQGVHDIVSFLRSNMDKPN